MSILKYVMGVVVAVALTACGGGGGNPGAASGAPLPAASAAALTPIITVPTISLAIVDSNGTVVSTNAIGSGALFYVNAIVKNASGNVVANKLVTFTTNSGVSTFVPASALTDLKGVAKVQIIPASVTAANAGNLLASTTVDTVPVSASLDYQTSAANVSLTTMLVASSPITTACARTVRCTTM